MNVLYKLSRQYAREEMTLAVFRSKRRQLIEAILAGELSEQTAITNIPSDETQDRTQSLDETAPLITIQDQEGKPEIRKPKSNSMKLSLLITLVLIVASAYFFSSQLQQMMFGENTSTVGENEFETMLIHQQLMRKWNLVIESNLYDNNTAQEFISLWEQASEIERERFTAALRSQLQIWESDFDKELEVSLTYQIMQTLGI